MGPLSLVVQVHAKKRCCDTLKAAATQIKVRTAV